MQHDAWQPLAEPSAEDVRRVLAEVDLSFGNVVERSAADVAELLASGSIWGVCDAEGRLSGVAGSVPDEGCVLGVTASQPGRAELMAEAVPLLDGALGAGAPLWLPTRDRDARGVAAAHGLVSAYTDLQMRIRTTTATSASPPPAGTRLRELGASPSDLRDVHDLVCAAWGVEEHWPAFVRRFEQAARQPALWVLLESLEGELLAACFGDVEELGDGQFGVVSHLDVAPSARRRGLGRWVINELLVRFSAAGQDEAQLGVHDDNASGAPALYRSLGWRVVSSQDKWVRPRA